MALLALGEAYYRQKAYPKAVEVLEQGLGGGFSSRMFSYIRTARGLAYATGAQAGSDFERPGVFLAYSLTKSESTMVALQLVRDQLRGVTQAPFNAQEMATAKQATQNSYVFNFEDPSQSLFRAAYYKSIGYPADFLQRTIHHFRTLLGAQRITVA